MTNNNQKSNKYNYLGAIHIHSHFSDGSGDIQQISRAAKKAGLSWIIITDHNNFDIQEGFYNGVCVIKGEEISPKDENHYLALGINKKIEPSFDAKENVNAVHNCGGFGFAAHPDEGINNKWQTRKNKWRAITWQDKKVIPDGVEIWNWFSQWGDNLNDRNIFSLLYAYLFKHNLVFQPSLKTLKWWDDLNNKTEKIVPAIGGVDAHAMKISKYIIPVTIFPYEEMFKTITNVITLATPLSDNFETQKAQILEAIKSGKNMIINRKISTKLPEFYIKTSTDNATSGYAIKLDKNSVLNVKSDKKYTIKIFQNGKEIKRELSQNLQLIINEIGKYRIEIIHKTKGLAYSNPILVY